MVATIDFSFIIATTCSNTTILCCCQSPAIVSTTGSSEHSSEKTRESGSANPIDTADATDATDVTDAIEAAVDPDLMDAVEEHEDNVEGSQEDDIGPGDVPGGVSMPTEAGGEADQIPNNDFCFTHDDFIEYQSSMNDASRHQNKHAAAWSEIKSMVGEEVSIKSAKDGTIKWKVVESVVDDNMRETIEREQKEYDKKVGMLKREYSTLSSAFWGSWPIDAISEIARINIAIDTENVQRKERYQRVIRHVSVKEFKYFNALMIGASVHGKQGTELWSKTNGVQKRRRTLSSGIDFGEYMKEWRFKEIKHFVPQVMEDESMKEDDDWWRFKKRVELFAKKMKRCTMLHQYLYLMNQ